MALKRILCSYVMYNFDLSYCQGMSDLAAPILYVISRGISPKDTEKWRRAEAEAFWCFAGMMDRVEANFHTDQRGMHSQLLALEKLLQLLDPQLYAHFKQKDCLNFFFCFRWVLILFKREFDFDEVRQRCRRNHPPLICVLYRCLDCGRHSSADNALHTFISMSVLRFSSHIGTQLCKVCPSPLSFRVLP